MSIILTANVSKMTKKISTQMKVRFDAQSTLSKSANGFAALGSGCEDIFLVTVSGFIDRRFACVGVLGLKLFSAEKTFGASSTTSNNHKVKNHFWEKLNPCETTHGH